MSRRINRRNALKAAVAGVGCAHLTFAELTAFAQEAALGVAEFDKNGAVPAELAALGVTDALVNEMKAKIATERFGSCEELSALPAEREASATFAFERNPMNEQRAASTMEARGFADSDPGKVASAFAAADAVPVPQSDEAQAIFDNNRIWNSGREITWCFVTSGAPNDQQVALIRQACQTAFKDWSEILSCVRIRQVADNTNAAFNSSNPDAANRALIRVSMIPDGSYRSLVGTDSQMFNLSSGGNASLNLSPRLTGGGLQLGEYTRLARHEAGHALGMLHEHQGSLDPIVWIVEAVYAYFLAKYGWGASMTKSQVIDKAVVAAGFATAKRDDRSIMHYWYPPNLYNLSPGGTPVPSVPNPDFSSVDRSFARQKYNCSGPDPNPVKPPEPAKVANVRNANLPASDTGLVGEEIRTPGEAVLYTVKIETAGTYHFETIDNPSITMKLTLFNSPDMAQPHRASNHHGGARLLNARIVQENLPAGTYYLLAEHYFKTRSSIGKFDIRVHRP